MTVAERLTPDDPADVIARHIARYELAVQMVGKIGGVWWDVGCGDGYGTELLPGDTMIGFDKIKNPSRPRCEFVRCNFKKDEWWGLAEPPDVIVCIETIEHLEMEDQWKLIHEFRDVLYRRAPLVICCPVGTGKKSPNPWHLHEPTEREMRMTLESAGFAVDDVRIGHYESTYGEAVQMMVRAHAV